MKLKYMSYEKKLESEMVKTPQQSEQRKSLCVILARAGSKGLKGKNARVIAGKPMVRWTIEHALFTSEFDYLTVSTDCQEVTCVAQDMGVDVVDRPEDLASDTATVDAAARHAVKVAEASTQQQFDDVVILYGNVPVRPFDLSQRALEKLRKSGCDSVQSLYQVGKSHPYWMKTLAGDSEDHIEPYTPNDIYRRQELPPVYQLDGGVIAVTKASLFNLASDHPHAFLGVDRRGIITQAGDVVDVDDALDLTLAEIRLSKKHRLAG